MNRSPNCSRISKLFLLSTLAGLAVWSAPVAFGQSVCLPAPRLLTLVPMGGEVGTQFEVTVTGSNLDDSRELMFSDSRISAKQRLDASGKPVPNKYEVTIADDCPTGVHEARVMTRLGMSSSRIFCVSKLTELVQKKPNTSLTAAMELPVNSICNASTTAQAVDYYTFKANQDQRIVVQCAAKGVDSKLNAVVILADSQGRDLLVERRGGALDFLVPEDGQYVIKVHELTYKGGAEYFYRLVVQDYPKSEPIAALPSTKPVNSFSCPLAGKELQASHSESEPNNDSGNAQKIRLPCNIAGSFFPAADLDVFEFEARKGEVWWVEVVSERLGLPTDPAILVQHVGGTPTNIQLKDVAEFNDIPSPVKVSSNGYAYDGPPYNAGSSDILAKLEIKQDGTHRLQLSDLFGGTRNDPQNIYRLIIRKAQPDFAIVAWPLHMQLRNGDRNALSKPISLRGGATMALEVVTIRRDGFNGEIELVMENLPKGVTVQGLTIPAGQSRGMMLITASEDAPRGITSAKFFGRASIDGKSVVHPGAIATMAWPVTDAWQEIPYPRLMADVPVSVGGEDLAPLSVSPAQSQIVEAVAGTKLTIPLKHAQRSEFSGAAITMKFIGAGMDRAPGVQVAMGKKTSEITLDLNTLKTPPGEYTFALFGGAVVKYRHQPEQIAQAESAKSKAQEQLKTLNSEVKRLTDEVKTASPERKAELDEILKQLSEKQKTATAALATADSRVKTATATAKPKDIADIVVTEPITIRVIPAEKK
ncbi:MAG: serine protease [Planctomycetaceae bacterium]|nr:serine protease [Planctomycetaceae bacterium]